MFGEGEFGPGRRIGNVVVEKELGTGAYGVVYRGRDVLLDRPVAVKVLRPRGLFLSPSDRQRFLSEAKVLARIASPNVVTLYQVHTLGEDGWALEMEYVEGGTLQDLLGEDARLPPQTVVRILRQVTAALAAAHAGGIVHGDVKPENVLFARDGTAKLTDFGLARVVSERELERSASTHDAAGTPLFMAPEVILGEGNVLASDVWSLGVLAHRMLEGRFPFSGANLAALFFAVQNAEPLPLSRGVPPGLADVVSRCLAKRPESRPLPTGDLATLLERALDSGPAAAPALPLGPPRPSSRPPLVGREADLRRFEEEAVAAAAGTGRAVLVSGPVGIGKTAFVAAAERIAARLGYLWIPLTVTASEGLLRPLLSSARWALSRGRDTAPLPSLDSLVFGPATPLLRRMLSGAGEVEVESRQQTVWALHHLFHGLAAERPVALAVEGMDHAEPQEAAILRDLARRIPESRVLLVVVARGVEDPRGFSTTHPTAPLSDVEGVRRISLGPLPREAVLALLEESTGARLTPPVAERLVDAADGNPLFALETLRHLEANGAVVKEGGEIRAGERWESVTLPERLVDLAVARVRGLSEGVRSILDVAAVDGLAFDGEAIAAVLKKDLLDVLRALQRLARDAGLLLPQARGYRFANVLMRDALYEQVAPDLRRELHRRLAEHLESRKDGVDPERLGTHWERAGREDMAQRWLLQAADLAAGRQESVRALDLARRGGVDVAAIDPQQAGKHMELLLRLASCLRYVGSHDTEVAALYDAVIRAAEDSRSAAIRWRAVVARADFRFFRVGRVPGDEEEVRAAEAALPVSSALAKARYVLGVMAKIRGDLGEAEKWLRSVETARPEGPDLLHGSVLDQLGSLALRRDRLREAESLYGQAAEACSRVGLLANSAASTVNQAVAAFLRGAVDGQEERLERAIRTLTLLRVSNHAAQARVFLAQVREATGDLPGAEQAVEEAVRILEGSQYLPGLVAAHSERAHLATVRGNPRGAEAALATALAAAERHDDVASATWVRALDAHLRCVRGDLAGAAASAQAALDRLGSASEDLVLVDLGLLFAEMGAHGLDAEVMKRALLRLEAASARDPDGVTDAPRAALSAAIALRTPGQDAASVAHAAARALLERPIGRRQAACRLLSRWFEVAALRLEGQQALADREAAASVERAQGLGDLALEWLLLCQVGGLSATDRRLLARRRELSTRFQRSEGAPSAS